MFDPNVSPGHGEFGTAPTKDADGTISLKELDRHITGLRALHAAARESREIDFNEVRKYAIGILKLVGLGEPESTGDSKRRQAFDRSARTPGGVSPVGIFGALKNFGAPQSDHVARAAPANIVGGTPIWAGLSRFGR